MVKVISGAGQVRRQAPSSIFPRSQLPRSSWSFATSRPTRPDTVPVESFDNAPADMANAPCVVAAGLACGAPFGIDPTEVPFFLAEAGNQSRSTL